jgi:beta-lactamase class A
MTRLLAISVAIMAAAATIDLPQSTVRTTGPQDAIGAARAAIVARIAASGAEVAVVWRPLEARAGEEIVIGPTIRFHAASTMKVPVMIELFQQVQEGRVRLDDTLPVTNQFRSLADGSPYTLSADADSDGETYKAIGRALPLRTLVETMIISSGNLAANLLIERLGVANIKATLARLDASGMEVLRGVEDQKAFDLGLNNTADAAALATLFGKLGRGEVVSPSASAEMIAILKRQRHNTGIPAGLPPDIAVAHKTGTITRIHHDAGIVYGPRPYVLVVLTRGLADEVVSAALIADVSRICAQVGR